MEEFECAVWGCRRTATVLTRHRGVDMFYACPACATRIENDRWEGWVVLEREHWLVQRGSPVSSLWGTGDDDGVLHQGSSNVGVV